MIKKQFALFFLVLIFNSTLASAQQALLTGTVTDTLDKPLFGVTVAVFGKPFGTVTDEKGKYSLAIPANTPLKIVVSFTGLQTDSFVVTLAPRETKEINRTLKGRIFQMADVLVEDKSFKKINITTINPKTVGVLPTPNQSVEDILKTMPGVSSANELSSTYSVRGGNYDENLVYINDFEVYRPL